MTREQRIARGDRIAEILKNEHFAAVVREVRDDIMQKAFATKPGDTALREDCYFEVRALARLMARLQGVVDDAALIRAEDT